MTDHQRHQDSRAYHQQLVRELREPAATPTSDPVESAVEAIRDFSGAGLTRLSWPVADLLLSLWADRDTLTTADRVLVLRRLCGTVCDRCDGPVQLDEHGWRHLDWAPGSPHAPVVTP